MVTFASWLVTLLGVYLAVGLLFGIPFVLRGVNRIDPAARESTRSFRLIILPGVIALWPILARRWLSGRKPPEEGNAHRDAARAGRAS